MRIVLSLLTGLFLGFVFGFFLRDPYRHTQYHQLRVCEDLYMRNINPNDPDIQDIMKEQGFKTVKALVQEHCRWYVVESGQTFEQ